MKGFLVVFLCLGIVFWSPVRAQDKTEDSAGKSKPGVKLRFPNIFNPFGNFIKNLFEKKTRTIFCPPHPWVEEVILSQTEITLGCAQNNSCWDKSQVIEVFTKARSYENESITYEYLVTGGKIVGKGAKVAWDLYGVKPGCYQITAAAFDASGLNGLTKTKFIEVVECPNCLNADAF